MQRAHIVQKRQQLLLGGNARRCHWCCLLLLQRQLTVTQQQKRLEKRQHWENVNRTKCIHNLMRSVCIEYSEMNLRWINSVKHDKLRKLNRCQKFFYYKCESVNKQWWMCILLFSFSCFFLLSRIVSLFHARARTRSAYCFTSPHRQQRTMRMRMVVAQITANRNKNEYLHIESVNFAKFSFSSFDHSQHTAPQRADAFIFSHSIDRSKREKNDDDNDYDRFRFNALTARVRVPCALIVSTEHWIAARSKCKQSNNVVPRWNDSSPEIVAKKYFFFFFWLLIFSVLKLWK